jgi:hypothetical protein
MLLTLRNILREAIRGWQAVRKRIERRGYTPVVYTSNPRLDAIFALQDTSRFEKFSTGSKVFADPALACSVDAAVRGTGCAERELTLQRSLVIGYMKRVGSFVFIARITLRHLPFIRPHAGIQVSLAIGTSPRLRVAHPYPCSSIHRSIELYVLQRQNREATAKTDVAKLAL